MDFPNRFTRTPLFCRKPSPKIVRKKLDFEKSFETSSVLTPDTTYDLDNSWEDEFYFSANNSLNTSMEMETPPSTTDNEEKTDTIRISDIQSVRISDIKSADIHSSTDIHPETADVASNNNENGANTELDEFAECTIMPNGEYQYLYFLEYRSRRQKIKKSAGQKKKLMKSNKFIP